MAAARMSATNSAEAGSRRPNAHAQHRPTWEIYCGTTVGISGKTTDEEINSEEKCDMGPQIVGIPWEWNVILQVACVLNA